MPLQLTIEHPPTTCHPAPPEGTPPPPTQEVSWGNSAPAVASRSSVSFVIFFMGIFGAPRGCSLPAPYNLYTANILTFAFQIQI